MKVLFITSYYMESGAISNCLKNILEPMSKHVDVEVAHMDFDKTNSGKLPVITHHIYNPLDNLKLKDKIIYLFKNERGIKKITRPFWQFVSKIVAKLNVSPKISYAITECASIRDLKKLISKNNYDCIISVCAYFSNHYIASKIKRSNKNIKWIAYYFDPYSFSQLGEKRQKQREKLEYKLLGYADAIIVTNQMEKEFKASRFCAYLDKTIMCEFPNIVNNKTDKTNTTIEFDPHRINCVFAGAIYRGIRDPEYLLEYLGKSDEKIKFYVVGRVNGLDKDELICKYKDTDKFEFINPVSIDECFNIMNDADILVNLGNNVKNLVPSKIFDYMSVCKPIINVCKIKDCPTLKYMEKYPYVLNLFETDEIDDKKTAEFNEFCIKSKDIEISFDEIKEKFETSCPEYVVGQIMNLLNKEI